MVELVVGLEGQARKIGAMALQRTYPALLGDHDRDRFALDKGFLDRSEIMLGRVGEGRAALAERRLRSKNIANLPNLLANFRPLFGFGAEQFLDALQFAAKILVLRADFHFLELAQRAQAHVEDGVGLDLRQLERLDQRRL